jgi:hypothetical protein
MKTQSNPNDHLLTVIASGHQIPPKNRFGIFAVHSDPPMTKREFEAILPVIEDVEPFLQADLKKKVALTSAGEFIEIG